MGFLIVTAGSAAVLKLIDCGQAVVGHAGAMTPALRVNLLVSGLCIVVILTCGAVVVAGALRTVFGGREKPEAPADVQA